MFKHQPALQFFVPFVLGIIAWQVGLQQISTTVLLLIILVATIILFLLQGRKQYQRFTKGWYEGIVISFCIFFVGVAICQTRQLHLHPKHYRFAIQADSSITIKGILQDAFVKKTNSFKSKIEINTVYKNGLAIAVQGEAYLYITKTDSLPNYQAGNQFLLTTTPANLHGNGNPGEFDYAAYSLRNGISHALFVQPKNMLLVNKNVPSIATFFANCKQWCLKQVRKNIPHSQAIGVAEALLVGDRADIDNDTWDAYQKTGIVHIIAISGMHLGIFYLQLMQLLLLIPVCKKNKKSVILFCLLVMWFFACMIGMPPSVMRAAVLFTCMGIGEMVNRQTNPYNLLVVSATILLLYQPNWILDVGCILSYAAIFGILLFAKEIEKNLYLPAKFGKKIIVLFSTTMSAQIFTFPICLYYFHQFPLMLLVSNFLAIPITFVVLYLLLVMMVFIWWTAFAKAIGIICCSIIIWLNNSIVWLSKIPFFNVDKIAITSLQYFLLMMLVTFASYAIIKKHTNALLMAAGSFLLFWLLQVGTTINALQQQKIVIHQASRKTIIQSIQGLHHTIISPDSLTAADQKNILLPTQLLYRATSPKMAAVDSFYNNYYFVANGKKIIVIQEPLATVSNEPLEVDAIVLSHSAKVNLINLSRFFTAKKWMVDGSNSKWKIEQWQQQAKECNIILHNTSKEGAIVLE